MATDPNKLNRIRQLSANVPILNEEAQARLQAGQQIQLQQLAASAPAKQLTTRAIQAMAPQITQQFGQQALQQQAAGQQMQMAAAQQAVQQQGAIQQQAAAQQELAQKAAQQQAELQQNVGLARQEEATKNKLTDGEIASNNRLAAAGIEADNNLSFLSRKQREDLSNLGRDVKAKLFDSRIQFARDENGRKFTNERQLMDFAVASAKSQQELAQKLQTMEQVATREIYMMETAAAKMSQALQNGYLDGKRELDQASRARLVELKAAADKEIAKKKAYASNMKMIMGGLTIAAGVATGGVAGGAMIAGGTGLAGGAQQ
jgi:hypothetical protein